VQEDGRGKCRLAGDDARDRIQIGADDGRVAIDIADVLQPLVG